MRIEEIMTRDVATCLPSDTGAHAAQIMWNRDCGCVPILDEEGRPAGMVTDRDLCMAAYTRGAPLHEVRLDSVMSRGVRACMTTDSLETAERTMAEAQVHRLPVVGERGHVVGIVSLGDIARARQATVGARVTEHVLSDVVKTLAAITAPRTGSARALAAA
jgi:CBS domain-containing protein